MILNKRNILLFSILLFSGCSLPVMNKNGSTYHLIVGIGLVTVNDKHIDAAVATRSKSLGLNISNQPGLKLGLGYSSSQVISVKDNNENIVVEIEDGPLGDILVRTENVNVDNGGNINEEN